MLPDPAAEPLLTVARVAELLPGAAGEKAVRAGIRAGQIPALRVGRLLFVPTAKLLAQWGLTPDIDEAGPVSPAVAATRDGNGPRHHDRHGTSPLRPVS